MLEGVVRVGTGTRPTSSRIRWRARPAPPSSLAQWRLLIGRFRVQLRWLRPGRRPGRHRHGRRGRDASVRRQASAPVFAMIVRDALQELGIPPHKAGAAGTRSPPGYPLWRRGRGRRPGPARVGGFAGRPGRPASNPPVARARRRPLLPRRLPVIRYTTAPPSTATAPASTTTTPSRDYDDSPLGSRELDEAECALENSARSGRAGRCRGVGFARVPALEHVRAPTAGTITRLE